MTPHDHEHGDTHDQGGAITDKDHALAAAVDAL